MGWYGNARHRATDSAAPAPRGPATGNNAAVQTALTYGPSDQAVSVAGSMGIAVHTMSPMSRGSRVWGGDLGYGVHRFSGRLNHDPASPTAAAVAPVTNPQSVRHGMNYGASQGQGSGYPSTGAIADYGTRALATMSMGQLHQMGYGG